MDSRERVQTRRELGIMFARTAAFAAVSSNTFAQQSSAFAAPMPAPTRQERGQLHLHDATVAGRRLVALSPTWGQVTAPLVVLLHGLGETGDARLGAYAWFERYGLPSSYARLFDYPVVRNAKFGYFPPSRIADINTQLSAEPMRPLAFLCPHVPVFSNGNERARYGEWLLHAAIPAARLQTGAGGPLLLGGCSLGGSVALELYLRYPSDFRAVALVQCALSVAAASAYAARIEASRTQSAPTDWYLGTSSGDPYRLPTRALGAALLEKHVQYTAREFPGPHDQPWLREVGTLDMLHWFDRIAWGSAL